MFRLIRHKPLAVGERAPDFSLQDGSGATVRLSAFRDRSAVVLYFYPKDNTYGCIAESTAFRDLYDSFRSRGAEIIGVSSDSTESHRAFADRYKLPFPLLSDPRGSVRKRFGVPRAFGLLPGRTTYVIDKAGVVRSVFSSALRIGNHVESALEAVRGLDGRSK